MAELFRRPGDELDCVSEELFERDLAEARLAMFFEKLINYPQSGWLVSTGINEAIPGDIKELKKTFVVDGLNILKTILIVNQEIDK